MVDNWRLVLVLRYGLEFLDQLKNSGLASFQYTLLQPTENAEGEDHTTALGLFEGAAEQVGEGPDVGGRSGRGWLS